MKGDYILLLPVLLPVLAGCVLAALGKKGSRTIRNAIVIAITAAELLLLCSPQNIGMELTLFQMTERLTFVLRPDKLSMIFGVLTGAMWLGSAVYSVEYMKHEEKERFYQVFFLISLGVIAGVCFSGNLLTIYLFYEMMTLATLPLVIQERTQEAIRAGLWYLFYSIGGAFLGLAGFFILYSYGIPMEFVAGGAFGGMTSETASVAAEVIALSGKEQSMLLVGVFLMIVGFGSKAGMFPLHGWLPVAHPVAPAPASALLSGNVTKMGLLVIVRVVYYVVGAAFIRGTWVQTAFLVLTLITIFMGSVIASREKLLKRRLAYSTVSQVSYALFGIAVMHPVALVGALAHVIFHSLVKNTLFLSAGSIIHATGKTKTNELVGIGKQMPVTMWLYTFVSLTLIGIPPTSAFLSKWYLAQGALSAKLPVFSILGPVVLLISAVFTAAYLLSVTIRGFLPGRSENGRLLTYKKQKESFYMLAPMLVFTIAAVGFGIMPNGLIKLLSEIAAALC